MNRDYNFLLLLFALVYGYLLDLKHAVKTKWLKPAVSKLLTLSKKGSLNL